MRETPTFDATPRGAEASGTVPSAVSGAPRRAHGSGCYSQGKLSFQEHVLLGTLPASPQKNLWPDWPPLPLRLRLPRALSTDGVHACPPGTRDRGATGGALPDQPLLLL